MKKKQNLPVFQNDFLDESWVIEEFREYGLREAVEELTKKTHYLNVNPSNFLIYSLTRPIDYERDAFHVCILDPDFTDIRVMTPKNLNQVYFRKENKNLGLSLLKRYRELGMTEKQIKEIESNGFFLQLRSNKTVVTMIPSKAFLATFCRQLGIGKLNEGIDPIRDIYLASRIRDCDDFTLVFRKSDTGYAKAFGCFSSKFEKVPQTIIFDFKDKLSEYGKISVRHWKMDHFSTTVDFALNDKAIDLMVGSMKTRIIPGVRLSLSDVGDSSYILQNSLLLNGGTLIFGNSVSHKHSVNMDIISMMDDYRDMLVQVEQTLKMLESLKGLAVPNKREAILSLMKKANVEGAFGKRNTQCLIDEYITENTTDSCDATEVILYLLKMPGLIRNKFKSNLVDSLSGAIGKLLCMDLAKVVGRLCS